MNFNVLTEPWIPVSNGDTLSLLNALENAHALEGVLCVSPLETVAVYRLMIAFLMDALSLTSRDDRLALLEQGRFDMDAIRAYVSRCEEEGASFDLFDPKRPFMQAAHDPKLDKESKPATNIALQIPSGNNHIFFDHKPEARFAPGEALRQLLTAYLFCTVGGRGFRASLNGKPCYYVLHHGNSLFDTLVHNMVSVRECGNTEYGKPAWREDRSMLPTEEPIPSVAMLAALTWQPRRVTMIPDADGRVSEVYWQPGYWIELKETPWHDPHVPYKKTSKGLDAPVVPQFGRAFWRDYDAMLVSKNNEKSIPPLVLTNALERCSWHRLFVVGMISDNAAKFEIIAHDQVKFPHCLLESEEHRDELRYCLETIEKGAKALSGATLLAFKESGGKKEKSKRFGESVVVPELENAFFKQAGEYVAGEYMEQLAACNTDEAFVALRKAVQTKVKRTMLDAIEKVFARIGSHGKLLLAQANVRRLSMFNFAGQGKKKGVKNANE